MIFQVTIGTQTIAELLLEMDSTCHLKMVSIGSFLTNLLRPFAINLMTNLHWPD